jgi:hypothetical protein
MSDAELIRATLKKVRRRQFFLIWLNASAVALPAFAFLILLFKFGFIALPGTSVGVYLTSLFLLLSAALAVSIYTMPAWKESVNLVDRALGLQQRLVTSWENIPPRDEIDSLLLADASKRIFQLQPASITPLRLARTTVVCVLVLLSSIAFLGIFRVIRDWNKNSFGVGGGITPRILSGSAPQKKIPSKAEEKTRANSSKPQNYVAADSNSEASRNSKSETNRASAKIPEQSGLHEAQKSPVNSVPDLGAAGLKQTPANASILKPGSADSTKTENRQPGKIAGPKQESKVGSSGAPDKTNTAQSNSGAESVRKADKDAGGASTSARLTSETKGSGSTLSAGSGKSVLTKKDAVFQNEYLQNYPAVRFAAEQALVKENIPPGMKQYIIDYFHAIHP